MGNRFIVVVLFAFTSGFLVIGYAQADEKPPLSDVRIGGEVLAGLVSGVAGGIGTYIAMYDLGMEPGFTFDELPDLLLSFGGTLSATALCSSTAVYLVGNIGNETGSFPKTLIGGILGALIGGGVPLGGCLLLIGNPPPSPNDEEPIEVGRVMVAMGSMVSGMIGATIGAIIGFNRSREYKSSAKSDSQANQAAPAFHLELLRAGFQF